jgi:Polysaccharide lyase
MREKTSPSLNYRCWRRRGFLLVTGALLVQSAYSQTAGTVNDSFETGTIQSSIWHGTDDDGCSASVQTGDAADGTHYMRSTLTAMPGGGSYRCEQNAKELGLNTPLNEDRYYGLSLRIPSATLNDVEAHDTLMQLHTQATMGSSCHYSIIWGTNNSLKWHPHSCEGIGGSDVTLVRAVQKDVWYRVCLNARWATNSSGRFRVWLNPTSENSQPALNFNGQTVPEIYNQPGKFKIGLYKPQWRTVRPPSNMEAMSPRVFYHDDVRVGKSFAEACGGGSSQPIPIPEPPISVAVE